MKKLMKYLSFLCILCVFMVGVTPPLLHADTIKPDICDVQTTFKIGGVDKTKVVVGSGTNTAIAYGVQAVTGSATVATGLGTVTAAVANVETVGTDTAFVGVSKSGANITMSVYPPGTSTLSVTEVNVYWEAAGSP